MKLSRLHQPSSIVGRCDTTTDTELVEGSLIVGWPDDADMLNCGETLDVGFRTRN